MKLHTLPHLIVIGAIILSACVSSGRNDTAGPEGTLCTPKLQNEGCYGDARMRCTEAEFWQLLEVCSKGTYCDYKALDDGAMYETTCTDPCESCPPGWRCSETGVCTEEVNTGTCADMCYPQGAWCEGINVMHCYEGKDGCYVEGVKEFCQACDYGECSTPQ